MKNPYIKQIFHLAWSMILCNITVPLLGMVDTMMMGHLHQARYLAAIGVGVAMFDCLFLACGFLRMGTTGMIAQAFGRRDNLALRLDLYRAFCLAGAIALLFIVFQHFLSHLIFIFIHPQADIRQLVLPYFQLRIWAAPATLANMVALGWFIGMQNTRVPLFTVACVNLIGIIADIVLVFGLHFTLNGVAIANIIAQYSGLLINIFIIRQFLKRYPSSWTWRQLINRQKLFAIFNINKHIFLRTLCLIFVFTFFTRIGSQLRQLILAANVVLMNFQLIMAFGLDGFVNATEALVGKTFGAKQIQDFNLTIKASVYWTSVIALLFCVVYYLGGRYIIQCLTSIHAVQQQAYIFLPYMIVSPLLAVWGFLFDGIYIGATKTKLMMQTMLVAVACFLLSFYGLKAYGNHGLWIAFCVFMLMRGVSMALVFWQLHRRHRFVT